jgi:hypothetical protein
MKYAVKTESGATIHIPIFIKSGSDIQKLFVGGKGIHRHTDNMMIS